MRYCLIGLLLALSSSARGECTKSVILVRHESCAGFATYQSKAFAPKEAIRPFDQIQDGQQWKKHLRQRRWVFHGSSDPDSGLPANTTVTVILRGHIKIDYVRETPTLFGLF